ncbi:MAG: glycosyltransferase family 2 protein [Euzebyales bacterium]|nr:glycosyltransferase family 2 protein [Euzebyales bacterium]
MGELRARMAIVDHADLHADRAARAAHLVTLAAAGVPVVVLDELDATLHELLGEPLATALEAAAGEPPADLETRERLSVEQRRAALGQHSLDARWRQVATAVDLPLPPPPTVSVVASTNRPDYLDNLLAQYAKQTYPTRELVLVLHGDAFGDGLHERIPGLVDGPVRVVRVDGARNLGEALNAGVAASRGEILSKMDDDDWYGRDHLADLVLALEYSGADLVGKGADFVWLAELGITIRRFTGYAETPSRSMGGGTLTMPRRTLGRAGGWPAVPTGVDRALIDAVLATGGRIHRTHGYGYLLNRHGVGHTWSSAIEYFIGASQVQRRGLDLALAACQP